MPLSHQIQGASTGLGSNNISIRVAVVLALSLLSIVFIDGQRSYGPEGRSRWFEGGFLYYYHAFRMAGSANAMPFQGIGNILVT